MGNISERSAGASLLFIHSDVDDAGLTPAQFRVLCHVARRGELHSSIETIAATCCVNRDTAWAALSDLESFGMIERIRRPGQTTVFKLTPKVGWKAKPSGKEGVAEKRGWAPVSATGSGKEGATPSGKEGAQSISPEVNPLKFIPSACVQTNLIDSLDGKSDAFKKTWRQWLDYRQSIKGVKKLQPVSIEALLRDVSAWTDAEFSEAVAKSISSGWRSVNRRSQNFSNRQPATPIDYSKGF